MSNHHGHLKRKKKEERKCSSLGKLTINCIEKFKQVRTWLPEIQSKLNNNETTLRN